MVHGGTHQKTKAKTIWDVLARTSAKMALAPPSYTGTQRSPRIKPLPHRDEGESDTELFASPLPSQASTAQPDLKIRTYAAESTQTHPRSNHRLPYQGDQVAGPATSEQEQRVDDLEAILGSHAD